MDRTNLDIDILRTLITAQRLGGFNRAAQRVAALSRLLVNNLADWKVA